MRNSGGAIGRGKMGSVRFEIWRATTLMGVHGITHNVYYVKSCIWLNHQTALIMILEPPTAPIAF